MDTFLGLISLRIRGVPLYKYVNKYNSMETQRCGTSQNKQPMQNYIDFTTLSHTI